MRIERLNVDEAQRLRAIRLRALRDAPDAFGSTFEESAARPLERWTTQLGEMETFVAVVDGADAGMARCAADPSRPDTAWLISMWVDPDVRRAGLGSALVDAVGDCARRIGASRLLLDVADDNVAAIALYARKGFEPTGETGSLPPPRQHVREHRRARALA